MYPQEIVIAIISVLALVIYFIIRLPRYKDEKQRLLNKYRRTQNISLRVQDNLSKYLLSYSKNNEEYMSDIDCQEYLRDLQKEYAKYLSKTTYLKIKKSNNRRVLRNIDNILNEQSLKLTRISDKMPEFEQKKALITQSFI